MVGSPKDANCGHSMINKYASHALAATQPVDDDAAKDAVGHQLERQLPSGRSLVLRIDPEGEEIELRSRHGKLEVRIVLTEAGPVVTLHGGRLEVNSPAVAFRCESFAVQASSQVSLTSQGEVRITADELRARTEQDIHLNGAYIRLNCTSDAPAPTPLPASAASKPPVP